MSISDFDLFNKFNSLNTIFFVPTWTTFKINSLDRPLFNRGIYLGEDQLQDIITQFEKLQFEDAPSEMREYLFNAYLSLVTAYFSTDSRIGEHLKDKTIADVLESITGLPSKTELLQEIKIDEIKDVGKVSETQIEEAANKIRKSYEKFKSVQHDPKNTMRFVSYGAVYYWIPEEYLP